MGLAKGYAAHWVTVADDGGHSPLAFDKPHTWSQKYNLVWDKILALNLFPPSVAENEITEYKSVGRRVWRTARFAYEAYKNRLVGLERYTGNQAERLRGDHLSYLRLSEHNHGAPTSRRFLHYE